MSDVLSVAEIAELANLNPDSIEPVCLSFDAKLNRLVSRASDSIAAAISLEPACLRNAMMSKS